MALGYIGKDKYGRNVSQVYCDICARENFFPMLHETLYNSSDGRVFCEMHAVLFGIRPSPPGFAHSYKAAQEKAEALRMERLQQYVSAGDTGVQRVGVPAESQQQ